MSLIDAPPVFSREMKLKAIERELGYRKRVYARRVGEGKMTQKQADYEIGVFEAIAKDYASEQPAWKPVTLDEAS